MKYLLLCSLLFGAAHGRSLNIFGDLKHAKPKDVPELESYEEHKLPWFVYGEDNGSHTNKRNFLHSGFPEGKLRAYDPVGNKNYDHVIVGETYEASWLSGYDYWRYVTVYNVQKEVERIAYLPYFEEDCHDSSWGMAQWGESRSLKVSLNSNLGIDALGLNASIGMSIESGVTFSTARRVQAVEGVVARHYPYKISDRWVGVTYIQTYTKEGNKLGYLVKPGGLSNFEEYPFSFELDNQNVGFKVKREVLNLCKNYDPSKDEVIDSVLYIR